MIVTITERQTFKRCRRKWHYSSRNRMNLQKVIPKAALSLGRLVHETLEDWLMNPSGDPRDMFIARASKTQQRAIDHYRKVVGASPDDSELNTLYEAMVLGRRMIENYYEYHGAPLQDGFELVSAEQVIEVPIFQDCVLEAKLDGIVRDRYGQLYILEHKTYGSRPNQHALDTNDQFLGYIWMLSATGVGQVVGVAYDGMWKRETPPRGSTMKDLFTRQLLTRAPEELVEFSRMALAEVMDMIHAAQTYELNDAVLYPNRQWQGCFDCDFDPICVAQSRGEDVEAIISAMYCKREDEDDDNGTE